MNILLPLDSDIEDEAKLTSLNEATFWGHMVMAEGRMQSLHICKSAEEITEMIDCIIVQNEKEYVWPYMEQNIAVLIAPTQRYIEDIVEAYIFKELYDISI
ncbi:hypothetical protein [Arcobacter sp. FWKO B]|uniref:hypothetical protein n=1 Tax=Arcobacter sp. FWKO B TaxID=2593672 RepID=UPI0018A3FA61|nr:hypothetical protein [Arcobacter sp. FWKO B]QOG12476.1 hypothetical protein FWKOB_07070 [Arcobacter sp. FWKO B]